MIVVKSLADFNALLKSKNKIALDSETTGLRWQKKDFAFLWAIATDNEEYVVDLRKVDFKLFYTTLREYLMNPENLVIGANPKFDLHMIPELSTYECRVEDIQVLYRLVNNDVLTVSLDAIASKYGKAKTDAVKLWIQKNKAYRWEKSVYGDLEKIPRYDAVPEELIYSYAANDARITYDLFTILEQDLYNLDEYNRGKTKPKTISYERDLEAKMLRVLFEMEVRGVKLDEDYTQRALSSERGKADSARERLETMFGKPFIDSSKALQDFFGVESDVVRFAPRTEKGSLSFADSYLSTLEHPAAKAIISHREAYKAARTYYANFIDLSSEHGDDRYIHTNFRQASTATGRLSASDPNMQNITAEDTGLEYAVRGCFVAPQDYYWVSMDYQAQEMRLMLDRAGQEDVIQQIKDGLDVHQATANLVGVSRKEAKAINFGILYGMGAQKLGDAVGVSKDDAVKLKWKYFAALPRVKEFINTIVYTAGRGKLSGIYGRIYQFQEKFAYKAINYLIQGGSASMTKRAMVSCRDYLVGKKSKLVLSVHDELVFYVHKDELDVIPELKKLMIDAYDYISLPMDVGVEIGHRWSELQEYEQWLENQKQSLKRELEQT